MLCSTHTKKESDKEKKRYVICGDKLASVLPVWHHAHPKDNFLIEMLYYA